MNKTMVQETKIVKDKEEVDTLDVTLLLQAFASLCFALINRLQKCALNLRKPLGLAACRGSFYFHKGANKEEEMGGRPGVGRR